MSAFLPPGLHSHAPKYPPSIFHAPPPLPPLPRPPSPPRFPPPQPLLPPPQPLLPPHSLQAPAQPSGSFLSPYPDINIKTSKNRSFDLNWFSLRLMLAKVGLYWNQKLVQQILSEMEPKIEEEENGEEESESKVSNNKSRHIKKSPKPKKHNSEGVPLKKKESVFSELRLMPQFGVFESEMQKQSRLQKFWLSEIDSYYRVEISEAEKEMLGTIIEEEVPTLKEVLQNYSQVLPAQKVSFEDLYRYVELVKECQGASQLMLVENQDQRFLAVFNQSGELDRLVEITLEQSFLLTQRQKFMLQLRQRQEQYNRLHEDNQHLSEISSEVAFLLYLMRQNKERVNNILSRVRDRAESQPKVDLRATQQVRDKYVDCLIRKNLRLALVDVEIDYLNYYANLDAIQQYGLPSDEKPITDKKEFQEYMKRKKSKKTRKNPKSVLKTACGGCLSAHYEQYNPFSYCPECHVRFHKYCYTPIKDGLCESCYHKKEPVIKGRAIECQLCPNRGLLSMPMKSVREGVSVHVFCMLVNGLWKLQNGSLQFQSNNLVNPNTHDDLCTICNSAVYTYSCSKCPNKAHPLCAFLNGWNIEVPEEGGVRLQCCKGVELQKNSYRRKFILNYKKILFKTQRER